MIRTSRLKTLKEMCLDKIQALDPASISYKGIPPHLVNQLLNNVHSPEELSRIQDLDLNKGSKEFTRAIDERWHQFVLKKFWVGKKNPPVLQPKETWKMFYDDLERQQKEALERQRLKDQILKNQEKKKKKSKIVDSKTAEKVFSSCPVPKSKSYRSSSVGSSNRPNVGSLAQDFMKKRKKFF